MTSKEIQLEKLTSEMNIIEQEIISISNMASEISDKFNHLSENIKGLSDLASALAGKKAGSVTNLIGHGIALFGNIYADVKKDEAIAKLLPKKQEIAKIKYNIISNYKRDLDNKIESLLILFKDEVNRTYNEEDITKYEELYGQSCIDSFHLYTMSFYMAQICDFMLAEFSAWQNGQNESEYEKPDKTYILEYVVTNIIAPNGLINELQKRNSTGGFWLLTKQDSLFAAILNNITDNDNANENPKRIVKSNSFKHLKNYLNQLKKVIKSNTNNKTEWLSNNEIYTKANKVTTLKSLNTFLFICLTVMYFISLMIISFNNKSTPNDLLFQIENLFSAIILAAIAALIAIPFCRIAFWVFDDNEFEKKGYYYLMILFLGIITLGVVPISFYVYLKKEEEFRLFLLELKIKINS